MNVKTPDAIKKGLECCLAQADGRCEEYVACVCCPYFSENPSVEDTLAYIQHLEAREWDLFDLLSSAWFGKRCYFQQEDGTVYSRSSGEYMSFDQAIDEFAHELTFERESSGEDIKVPSWISVEERLPKRNEKVVVTDGKHAWDYGQFNGLAFCFEKDNPSPREWNWKKHTVRHVEWWMPKETALPEPPKEG